MDVDFKPKRGPMFTHDELIKKAKEAMENLSPQQIEFCHAMLSAESQKQAAEMAGYSANTATIKASQLMAKEEIQEYLAILSALRSNAMALDSTEIISLQLRTYYECMQEGKHKEANTALDQLAKMKGMYNQVKMRTRVGSVSEEEKSMDESQTEIDDMVAILAAAKNRKETA